MKQFNNVTIQGLIKSLPIPTKRHLGRQGFTLIELLLVMAIFAILSALATINLLKPQTQASVDTTTATLVSDIHQQQIKAMVGDSEGTTTTQPQGIYFEINRYTLFRGPTFSPSDPNNFIVNLEGNIILTNITFPSSQVVYLKRSGEVTGFVAGSNGITLKNTQSNEQKTITINRFGAVTIN